MHALGMHAKIEEEKRQVKKLGSDKKEMALAKVKHEERMSQERELLDQKVKLCTDH